MKLVFCAIGIGILGILILLFSSANNVNPAFNESNKLYNVNEALIICRQYDSIAIRHWCNDSSYEFYCVKMGKGTEKYIGGNFELYPEDVCGSDLTFEVTE